MGIRTVAVYSEADARSLHVDMADESYPIGPPAARQSYLKSETIVDIARASGAEAIHPGYGFLSENPDFADAVEKAGIAFIGPSAKVIRLMGDKLHAKMMARQANVPLVPGSEAPVSTSEEVKALGAHLGYPLLLKAVAGGGGKGMRIVEGEGQVDEGLQRTISEANSSFGDGRVFVEKFLESPRHIEIQVLADRHGKVIHLGERECSLQRRHQKVMEESPSPFVTPQLREAMAAQAVALARQVGYTSAGTVEFMVTPGQDFYFLEMNTRLQVEHPVTEMVTGLDLVEQMICIAAGQPLPLTQNEVTFSGHAIEARVYAEDATHGFVPSGGRIRRFGPPPCDNGLRLDTGVEAGGEVSLFYDPMIAKLTAWAPTRHEAIKRLKRGLAHFIVEGPVHNLGFLEHLLHHPKVVEGDFTTHFIETLLEGKVAPVLSHKQTQIAKVIAALFWHREQENGISAPSQWVVVGEEESVLVEIHGNSVVLGQETFDLDLCWQPGMRQFVATGQGERYYGQVEMCLMGVTLSLFGVVSTFQVMRPKVWDLSAYMKPLADGFGDNLVVKSPMPGIVVSLPVGVGEHVRQGQTLVVVEAMKMENALKAPLEGTIADILVCKGDILTLNQPLVRLE